MDTYEAYRSPSVKAEPRWGGRDDVMERPPVNDSYRVRRSPPGMQERRGGFRGSRARSRSPVMIDRYQPAERLPREDFYGQSREHASRDREDRRRPPSPIGNIDRYVPGPDAGKPTIRTNPLPNPLSLDFQVGFNWFAEWWRVEQSIKEDKERLKNGGRRPSDRGIKGDRESRDDRDKERGQIQAAYDTYKEELQVKMARTFVQQHKGEEWFRERYLPEIHDPFHQRLMDFRRSALAQWERDIEAGIFDEFTLEGIYKTESNGMGGIIEKEEGETVAAAEVLGVGDLVPSRGGDIRDESALQPALLIKTLAPMVTREKIEDFCREHLGEQEGGFKWLSLSDPNPLKKCHRIGWIMLHPGAEVVAPTERGDGRDEEGEEDGVGESKGMASTAERALEAINGKTILDEVRGDFTCHVGVHLPPREPRKKALWDLFSAPERIDRDLQLAKRLVSRFDQDFGTAVDGLGKIEQRVEDLRTKGWLQAPATGTLNAKKERKRQILGMDDDEVEDGEEDDDEDEGAYDEEVDDEDLLIKKKTLDLLVEYLRRVFNFCFFCVFESDSIHELMRKCPGGHLRRPRASLSTAAKAAAKASAYGQPYPLKRKEFDEVENGSPMEEKKFHRNGSKNDQQLLRAFNWVKTFEDKILQILEPENVDVKKLGGKPIEEGLDEELKKFVKQEDEAKFRCKVPECTKLFKGEVFWRKHVEKRHPEWFESIKKDLNLVNTYVLDPSHIAPSRSDANSNGHFPTNNAHSAAGTPRGFNLASMPPLPFLPAFPPQPGFPPFTFGHHTVQTPPGTWPGAPLIEDMHHPGPMRRGGGGNGRFQNNSRSSPYHDLSRYKNQPPQSQSDLATETQLPINKKQAQATPAKVLSDKKEGNNHP
ncbi:arsenite resistance protein ars2 [Lasallia pustulata]|uniref:Arsenite resistance protein ars2 n=1 Tax=Lasallia pustulata TaxID=136370 RepID=A0A1W5DBV5_9LECA|nr:arsenite resistance protein ars2 [Lasallia pustulata]